MASGEQALLLALANQAGAVDESPYFGAGQAILQSQLPRATNNTEAILGPILQGLVGGGLSGYGQGATNKASFNAFAQNPILQSLGTGQDIGPVASGDQYGASLLADAYAGEMPANWTPGQGKSDILSALITKQAVEEDEEAKREQRQKIAAALLPKGMQIGETGEIVPIAGFAEVNADIAKAEADAKNKSEASKPIAAPAAVLGELADQKGIVDEATQLGNTLKTGTKSWSDLRKAEMFSGLDDDGIAVRIKDLADRVLRSRSGAAAPVAEVLKLQRIIAGDRTATPQEAGELILKFANREKQNALSKIDLINTPGGLEGMKTSFEGAGPAALPTPPAGYELTGKIVNGKYGMRRIR